MKQIIIFNGLRTHCKHFNRNELPTLMTQHHIESSSSNNTNTNESEDSSEPPKNRRKLSSRSQSNSTTKSSSPQTPIISIRNNSNNNNNSHAISLENEIEFNVRNDIILDYNNNNNNEMSKSSNDTNNLNYRSISSILASHFNHFKQDLLSNLSSKTESRLENIDTNEEMKQQLIEKDKKLLEKEKELIEKEKQIVEKEKQLIEKDKEISAKDAKLKQKDVHIRVLRSRGKHARAELKEWKVSKRKLFSRMTKKGKRKRAMRLNDICNKATDNDEASRNEANDILMNANEAYKNKYQSKLYKSFILRHNNLVNADAKDVVRRLSNAALSIMFTISRTATESISKVNNRAFDIKREEEGLYFFLSVWFFSY